MKESMIQTIILKEDKWRTSLCDGTNDVDVKLGRCTKKPCECKINAGETIYFPVGWNDTMNLEKYTV